jgi:glycosyltransferase involved in cell wall biosynthesis
MVTTIHDLCCLMEPFSRWSLLPRAELWSACVRANQLICISEFTYSMLKRWAPTASQRATVVHNGIESPTIPLPEACDRVSRLCPDLAPSKYLMWIGHPCARKNPELLFSIFGRHHRQFPDLKFVIVAPDRSHDQLRGMAQANGIAHQMHLFSRLDNTTRDSLYRCALALVFPSRCEGFGYPVLEAMCQGCPAFAYEEGPAKEMVYGILPMATALTLEAFTKAMGEYLGKSEADRNESKNRLISEAARFSSQMTAHKTMGVLRKAAGWPEEQQNCTIS